MNYGEVLSRAWQIIWRHKALWLFGILAGCGQAANSGGGNTGVRSSREAEIPLWLQRYFDQTFLTDDQIVLLVGLILLLALMAVVLVLVLDTVGRAGLIYGTESADREQPRLRVGDLFNASMAYFWRVLGVNLVARILLYLVIGILAIPFVLVTCGIGFILLPLVFLFIELILEQANIAIVTENQGIMDGLRRAWDVVRQNLGPYILMALILFVIGFLGSILIGLPVAIIATPLIAALLAGTQAALRAGIAGTIIAFLVYLPVMILLHGILRAYITSAWTLTFLRLTRRAELIEASPSPM